ncbi:glycosyltransferase family 1 protein [Candidatus Woesearchaeota archaeon]|nr:MAG: glycosyltransferase family 1 protein [Candidatus Woesearchaeota archaeon]
MKVLMLGWEFPPYKSGGLGTACKDLTKGLSNNGVDVTFVMPHHSGVDDREFVRVIGTKGMKIKMGKQVGIKKVNTILTPYMTSKSYKDSHKKIYEIDKKEVSVEFDKNPNYDFIYGKDLFSEVHRYTKAVEELVRSEEFDIIHAHDWMTYKAGLVIRKVSGKPLVIHIHSTEYDRTADHPNQRIEEIERSGLENADHIIANSNFTKNNVLRHYGISPEKISVVHWGIEPEKSYCDDVKFKSPFEEKIVMFLGRITIQKGPDYFVEAANKVLLFYPKVKFVVVGTGDMMQRMIDRADELGILDKFVFTGFLKEEAVNKAFKMADIYVMPSVSEPFGLVALEALKNKTPIIISKQSGVSEVVKHALKVDFWDINEMTNKIVNLLEHKELYQELQENSYEEVKKFNLDEPAMKCKDVYEKILKTYKGDIK